MDRSLPQQPTRFPLPEVSIIVPARNEEENIGACLESLTAQSGTTCEIIVVDDGSGDRTGEIAGGFAGVRVISSGALPEGWTGKNSAVVAGAKAARGNWLLFTDADTVHRPGSLARVLDEANKQQADLLSYSPEQMVVTFAERAVMPVVFSELAAQYPPHKVRDQGSGIVAANGQYILARRSAYESVGGHAAVAKEILEDVALALLFRNAGYRIYFRYGGDAVRTRMYRNWAQLREGWTKNLALLFPHPGRLALRCLLRWVVAWASVLIAAFAVNSHRFAWGLPALFWLLVYWRIRSARFTAANNLIAVVAGLPLFAYLLLRSKTAHAQGQVSWKGRIYGIRAPLRNTAAEKRTLNRVRQIENAGLSTESQ